MRPATAPLVGRETELKRIDAAFDTIESGFPACIAIAGEPGIGKSRLTAELRARAEARGHVVLDGMAAEFERDLAYSVVIEALDAYLASYEPALLEEWGSELLGALGAIFPSIARSHPGSAEIDRHSSHRAFQGLLERLASPRPLVITLDDVHWADSASVALIGALLRRGPEAGVLLVLAYRPGQADAALTAALSSPAVRHLRLGRLTQEESRELLGPGVSTGAAAEIFFETAGNPFCLEQLARASSRTTTNSGANANALELGIVPAPVAVAIADEISGLGGHARTLLDAAAVAGEPFELDLAAEIGELTSAQALEALDLLLAAGLARQTDVPRRFLFRHPLVRRAVYEAIPGGWRLAAHDRAARVLEARGASAAERALHVEHSAKPGDEEAIALLIEAGGSLIVRVPGAAARRFEAALRLVPSGDVVRRTELLMALAAALSAAGDQERSHQALVDALALLPAEAEGQRAMVTAAVAAVDFLVGRGDEAHARLAREWEGLSNQDSREGAALALQLSTHGLVINDFDLARDMGLKVVEQARALGDEALEAAGAARVSTAESAAGRDKEAAEMGARAREITDRASDAEALAMLDTLYFLVLAGWYSEDFDQALAAAERGLELSRGAGEARVLVPMMVARMQLWQVIGRLEEGRAIGEEAVEIARLSGNAYFLHWALWGLARTRLLMGDVDEALTLAEESAATWTREDGSAPMILGEPGWTLGRALVEAGEPERGLETMLLGSGGPDLEKVPAPWRCHVWLDLCVAELACGRPDVAEQMVVRAETHAGATSWAFAAAHAARARAILELARGAHAAAIKAAEAPAAGFLGSWGTFEAAQSALVMGRALAAAGEKQRAIEVLRRAEQELAGFGAIRQRDEARRELRVLGARAEPRGKAGQAESGLDSLTAREREIADLVTDRKTNRQIAEQLFLSEKTIETHLRNVFGKLGAANRVEVARAVERARRG